MKGPFGEKIVFSEQLKIKSRAQTYFFIDSKLKKQLSHLSKDHVRFLNAHEKLKTLEQYTKNIDFLNKKKCSRNDTIVAIGGGTITDSIGFLASTYLRGLNFICVPTTWLAAVDAGVGGKTALNFDGFKNQIGTIWPPLEVHFCSSLIGEATKSDSKGEVLKTLLLNHHKKWAKDTLTEFKIEKIKFQDLKHFIKFKTELVKKDPDDTKGLRAVLNFGHTLGHSIELNLKLSHGEAVCYGLKFALEWSRHLKLISEKKYLELEPHLPSLNGINLTSKELKLSLLKDKKRAAGGVSFIFLSDRGPVIKTKNIESIVDEFKRQQNI